VLIFFCGGSGGQCPAAGVGPREAGSAASFHRGQYTAMIHISSMEKMLIWFFLYFSGLKPLIRANLR
jgi:hypothetical protein